MCVNCVHPTKRYTRSVGLLHGEHRITLCACGEGVVMRVCGYWIERVQRSHTENAWLWMHIQSPSLTLNSGRLSLMSRMLMVIELWELSDEVRCHSPTCICCITMVTGMHNVLQLQAYRALLLTPWAHVLIIQFYGSLWNWWISTNHRTCIYKHTIGKVILRPSYLNASTLDNLAIELARDRSLVLLQQLFSFW